MTKEERHELGKIAFLLVKLLFKLLECIGMFYILILSIKHLIHVIFS